MVSHSTRAKRRRNAEWLKARDKVILTCIDRRVDFWLMSVPRTPDRSTHFESYGKTMALRKLKRFLNGHPTARHPSHVVPSYREMREPE